MLRTTPRRRGRSGRARRKVSSLGASTRWKNFSAAHRVICSPSGSCGKARVSCQRRAEGGGAAWPPTSRSAAIFVGWRGLRRLRLLLGLGGQRGQFVDREAVAVTLLAVLFPRLLRGCRAHVNRIARLKLLARPFHHAFLPRENRVLQRRRRGPLSANLSSWDWPGGECDPRSQDQAVGEGAGPPREFTSRNATPRGRARPPGAAGA